MKKFVLPAKRHSRAKLKRDLVIVALSIVIAILLVKSSALDFILVGAQEVQLLGSFIAGLFFTSIFTTPLAIVAFSQISIEQPVWLVALIGACGALIGDLILFLFMKNNLREDVDGLMKELKHKRIFSIFRLRIFRWLTPVLGALIIASPFPDELGLALMGLSRATLGVIVPVSLVMNFIGILIIGLVSNNLI